MSIFDFYEQSTRANFLPVSEQEMSWGMYVTGAGFDDMRPGRAFVNEGRPELYRIEQGRKRILPEYVLIYILDGAGRYVSDAVGSVPVRRGAFFILFPGFGHQLIPDATVGWKDIWITGNGPYIHELTQQKIINPERPIVYIRPEDNTDFPRRIERLCRLVLDKPPVNSPNYSSEFLGLITEFVTAQSPQENAVEADSEGGNQPENIVRAACKEIWNWGHREVDINVLSKRLNVNRRSLERYFDKYLHRTIREEIHRCRMYRAITLLQQTNISIEQIALTAGFPSYVHMIRVFKRMLGKTPGDFRP